MNSKIIVPETVQLLPESAVLVSFYWLFVVYGSLVPLDFQPIDLGTGWARFQEIGFLDLSVVSRADWIANILLYIPLAFLLCESMGAGSRALLRRFWVILTTVVLCAVTAVAVEFIQQYVPPRTVSLNDLLAEGIGIGLGIMLWLLTAPLKSKILHTLAAGGAPVVQAGLIVYAILYFALILFPFDFVVSQAEFNEKLSGLNYGLFVTPAFWVNPVRRVAVSIGECLSTAPLGALVVTWMLPRRPKILVMLFLGGLLGVIVEFVQLFLASGMSQGFSVLSRMVGVAVGARAAVAFQHQNEARFSLPPWTRTALLIAAGPFLLTIASLNGWFSASWEISSDALVRLRPEQFLPLYYHYYTTETNAVASVLSVFGMYLPIGIACWLWDWSRMPRYPRPWRPATLAMLSAAIIETGNLFVIGRHPDPTNLLLAAASASLGYLVLVLLSRTGGQVAVPDAGPAPGTGAMQVRKFRNPLAPMVGVVLLVVVAVSVAGFPIFRLAIACGLGAYCVLLWWKPPVFIFFIPALLPVFDLADRSGRFFWNEFDLLLTSTLAILLLRSGTRRLLDGRPLPTTGNFLWQIFVLIYAIGVIRGLPPFAPFDANSFASYYSPYNALRVGKGVIWVWVFTPFLAAALSNQAIVKKWFVPGMLTGLAGTIAAVLWERHTFVGLFDLANGFRAMATFNDMHVGGGSIDAYLSLSLPFVAACFLLWRGWSLSILGLAILMGGLFAFMLTFSRIDAAALAIAFLVILMGIGRHAGSLRRVLWLTAGLVAVGTVMVLAIISSPFAQSRWSLFEDDLQERVAHWKESLALKPRGFAADLFGAGTGSLPRIRLLSRDPRSSPATYQFIQDGTNQALEFGIGLPTYVLQRLPTLTPMQYELRLRIRSLSFNQRIGINICVQSVQFSVDCVGAEISSGDEVGTWHEESVDLDVQRLLSVSKPLYLALFVDSHNEGLVAVDDLKLTGPDGNNVLVNGDFGAAHDRWFFASDVHNHWHAFSLFVHLLFEQGWAGVVAFTMLVSYSTFRLLRAADNPLAIIILASIAGCLVIGVTDSVLDAPRISLLFFMLQILALQTRSIRKSVVRVKHRR